MTLADLSSPTYTGADLSTRVNAILLEARSGRRFLSVASVLADTTMAYSGGSRRVAAGDRVVTADGFAYEVTLSGATNHHLATAGGVKLTVLETPAVDVRAFGALGDGVADDTAAIQRMIDAFGYFTLPRGTFKITDSLLIPSAGNATIGTEWSGKGMEASHILCVGMAGKAAIRPGTPTMAIRLTMRDFRISGDCASAIDLTLAGGSYILYQAEFRNLVLSSGAGSAFVAPIHFSCAWYNVHVNSVAGHGFDIGGGNSTVLVNCYAHKIEDPAKAGYRITGQATLIACNGLDTNALWGDFGATAALDGANQVFQIRMIGCNLEDFGTHAIELRNTGQIILDGNAFVPKASGSFETLLKGNGAAGLSSWTLRARNNTYASKGAAMTGPSRILTSGGPALVEGDGVFTDYRHTGVSLTYTAPRMTQSGPAYGKAASRFVNLDAERYWGYAHQVPSTWTVNATAMSVAGRNTIRTANTAATTLQTASGGEIGQRLTLVVADALTTLQHGTAAGAFRMAGGANLAAASGDVFEFVHNGTHWRQV